MRNDNMNSVGDGSEDENICSLIYCNLDILIVFTLRCCIHPFRKDKFYVMFLEAHLE